MKVKLKQLSAKVSDLFASFIGSWTFIGIQSTILFFWVIFNADHFVDFDPYPFILLNLFLSFQSAYATPFILMSANRQADRDRKHLLEDIKLDREASVILQQIAEDIKLDKVSLRQHAALYNEIKEIKTQIEALNKTLTESQKNI